MALSLRYSPLKFLCFDQLVGHVCFDSYPIIQVTTIEIGHFAKMEAFNKKTDVKNEFSVKFYPKKVYFYKFDHWSVSGH